MAIKPINYEIDQSQPIPFLEGMKEGLQLQEIRQKRQAELARQEQEKQKILAEERRQQLYQRLLSPDVAPEDYKAALLVSDEAKAKSIMQMMEQSDKAASRAAIVALSPVVSALHAGNPDRAIALLEQRGKAYEGRPDVQEDIQNRINLIKTSPESAKFEFGGELSVIPGGSDVLGNILKLTEEKRAQEQAKVDIRKGTAEATSAEAEAEFARRQEIASLEQKAASIGLSRAQTSQSLAQTRNLTEQGRMLALDFKAALNGLPLPSKGGGTKPAAAATEDERKAAGWLSQADNAYKNMLSSMYTKEGKRTGAEKPGFFETIAPIGEGALRSPERQRFVQASDSLGEAILRAATGAGVNKDEAAQKARELTPVFTDDESTRKQKLAAIPVYLQSLQTRAGRAAPEDYRIPQPPGQPEQPQGMPQGFRIVGKR
jgi:hypothetical protein